MNKYLIIDNNTVVGIVMADNSEMATEITGKESIEMTENIPHIGWKIIDGKWINPQGEINE